MSAPTPRMCAHADESAQLPTGEFYIQFITEDEPGYNRSTALFADLTETKARATIFNHLDRRLTQDQVLEIRASSYRAGKVNP